MSKERYLMEKDISYYELVCTDGVLEIKRHLVQRKLHINK